MNQEFIDIILGRRSIRKFTGDDIPDADIKPEDARLEIAGCAQDCSSLDGNTHVQVAFPVLAVGSGRRAIACLHGSDDLRMCDALYVDEVQLDIVTHREMHVVVRVIRD